MTDSNRTEIEEILAYASRYPVNQVKATMAIEALLQDKMPKQQVKQFLNLAFDMYARGQQPNDQQFDNLWEDFKKGER